MEFSVWDMFCEIGMVAVTQIGLYYEYAAEIHTLRSGFVRLYCHTGDSTHRLGIFSAVGEALRCSGRISVRTLGEVQKTVRFTIQSVPFYPLITPLDGGYLPQNALYNPQKGRRFVAICHENDLPDEVLPYFCFLREEVIDGTFCLVFDVDLSGKPIIPKQNEGEGITE